MHTVNIPDGKCNLLSQLFLVELHPDYLVGEPLVEQSVDLGASAQLHRVDRRCPAALNGSLEVLLQLLNHLQHGLCLDARVVGLEVFVLLHFLLQAQHLPLQPVPQRGQGVTNVVGQLSVELLLEPGGAGPVCQMSVRGVGQEEFPLRGLRIPDVFLSVNILLTSVHYAHVTPSKREKLVLQNIFGKSSLVRTPIVLSPEISRNIALDHCGKLVLLTLRVRLPGELERVAGRDVRVGRGDGRCRS